MRALALGLLVLTACGPAAYSPRGVLSEPDVDAGTYRNLGCLDLAFGLRPPLGHDDVALLVVRVGNTCLKPTPFDLRGTTITAIDREGAVQTLTIADPRDEIRLLHLDAGARGVEKVRLRGTAPTELVSICIDIGGVSPGSSQPPGPPFCFRPSPAGAQWTAS